MKNKSKKYVLLAVLITVVLASSIYFFREDKTQTINEPFQQLNKLEKNPKEYYLQEKALAKNMDYDLLVKEEEKADKELSKDEKIAYIIK